MFVAFKLIDKDLGEQLKSEKLEPESSSPGRSERSATNGTSRTVILSYSDLNSGNWLTLKICVLVWSELCTCQIFSSLACPEFKVSAIQIIWLFYIVKFSFMTFILKWTKIIFYVCHLILTLDTRNCGLFVKLSGFIIPNLNLQQTNGF